MVISPLQKYGLPSQCYGGRFFAPDSTRLQHPRDYAFCGVGLQADTVDSRTCPPEGGRYMNQQFWGAARNSTDTPPRKCELGVNSY
jgi:hypothetical protein